MTDSNCGKTNGVPLAFLVLLHWVYSTVLVSHTKKQQFLCALGEWCLPAFVNLVLKGGTPLSVRHVFFCAILIPLRKKDAGVRPIAVGNTL